MRGRVLWALSTELGTVTETAMCTCQVSLAHWNQDDEYGGFGGAHAMVRGGYSGLLEPLADRLDVRLGAPVARIVDTIAGVRVTTASGARL